MTDILKKSASVTCAPPSEEELGHRLDLVLEQMDTLGVSQFVVVDPDNIFWLTNFANFIHERPFVLVVNADRSLKFVVPQLEETHVKIRAKCAIELVSYFEFPAPKSQQWSDVFIGIIDAKCTVGIEENCPHFVSAVLPRKPKASDCLERLRYIKSDYEIARIRYTCGIATDRMAKLLKSAKPGKSALSVHSKVQKLGVLKQLLDNPDTNMLNTRIAGVVQPPKISHDPHNFSSVFELGMQTGGINTAIVAGTLDGYGCEVERSFFLGNVPEAAKKPYDVMMQARALSYEMCKPGASMHDVDEAVNNLIRKAGFGDNLLHRTGHGIGVTAHEGPFLAEGFHHEIKPGMVFTIEPGIYIDGLGGFRHSDTVLVTETGNENLTPLTDSLEEMTIPVSFLARFALFDLQQPLLHLGSRLMGIKLDKTNT